MCVLSWWKDEGSAAERSRRRVARQGKKERKRKEGEIGKDEKRMVGRMIVVDAMCMCVEIILTCKTRGRMLKTGVTVAVCGKMGM